MDPKERLARQRKLLQRKLGLDMGAALGMDTEELFNDEDLEDTCTAKAPGGKASACSSSRNHVVSHHWHPVLSTAANEDPSAPEEHFNTLHLMWHHRQFFGYCSLPLSHKLVLCRITEITKWVDPEHYSQHKDFICSWEKQCNVFVCLVDLYFGQQRYGK